MRQFINPASSVLMLFVGSCLCPVILPLRRQFVAPILSFSTIFSPSRAWRTRRATLLEPLLKWLGMTLFLTPPIDLGHGANPRATREIQVPCRVSSSCVEPVLIVGSKFFMLGQLDGVTGTCIFPDFLRKAARALTNSCWFTPFTVTPGILQPLRCQPGESCL